MRDLKRSLAKIKRETMEPYEGAQQCAQQLHNVQTSVALLKKVSRMLVALRQLLSHDSTAATSEGNGPTAATLATPGTTLYMDKCGSRLQQRHSYESTIHETATSETACMLVALRQLQSHDTTATATEGNGPTAAALAQQVRRFDVIKTAAGSEIP